MTLEVAYAYVHRKSVGDLSMCEENIRHTEEKLDQLYIDQSILGYQLLLTESQAHAEEEFVKASVEQVTQGRFPFVYARIQPLESNTLNLNALMEELNYTRV